MGSGRRLIRPIPRPRFRRNLTTGRHLARPVRRGCARTHRRQRRRRSGLWTADAARWRHAALHVSQSRRGYPLGRGPDRRLLTGRWQPTSTDQGGSDARYLPTGHLLYAVAGTMYAVPFDAGRLVITGAAVPAVVGVGRSRLGQPTSATHLAVSETGTLVYVPGSATTSTTMFGLVLGDGASDPIPLKVPPAAYTYPRVSPDGRVLAVGRSEGRDTDIWMYDLAGKTESDSAG